MDEPTTIPSTAPTTDEPTNSPSSSPTTDQPTTPPSPSPTGTPPSRSPEVDPPCYEKYNPEEYCNDRGEIVDPDSTDGCKCKCDEGFAGDQCEYSCPVCGPHTIVKGRF